MVGLIIAAPVARSPFIKKYVDCLEEERIPYEVVEWVRKESGRSAGENTHTFFERTEQYSGLLAKVQPFLHFRRYAKRIIQEKKYDKLVVLTTQSAVVLFDVLLKKKYKNKYFFDYRDTSYEYIRPYKRLIDRIIRNSYATCISSDGFRKYLTDKKELILSHNFQDKYYDGRVLHCAPRHEEGKIVMGYVGYLREYEYLTKVVDVFGNDPRFTFRLYGGGDCEEKLRDYASRYANVEVLGAYKEEDKMAIVDSFDMICYNYPTSFVNYPAVANKFYDGMIRKKPMFSNLDTFSGEQVAKHGLGIGLHENETGIADKIYEYYETFDRAAFEKNCEDYLAKVMQDERRYVEAIRGFLKGENDI